MCGRDIRAEGVTSRGHETTQGGTIAESIRQWLLPEIGDAEGSEPKYGLVLALILATLAITALVADLSWGASVIAVMQGTTLIIVLRISDVHRILKIMAMFAVVSGLLAMAVSTVTVQSGLAAGFQVLTGLFALATPFAIASRLRSFRRIGRQAVMAALCVYLTIGYFFVAVFGVVDALAKEPIFVQIAEPDRVDLLYFSYVTLTTVGYGDLSANLDSVRLLAIMEALIGQLYLVSVVGLVVGNIGAVREPGPGAPARAEPPAESAESS